MVFFYSQLIVYVNYKHWEYTWDTIKLSLVLHVASFLAGEVLAHKTSVAPPHFIEVSV